MESSSIFIVILVLIILFIVVKYVMASSGTSGLEEASTETTIRSGDLEQNSSINSAYSLWFYIQDRNENYGSNKDLMTRLAGSGDGLKVNLGTYENKMDIDSDYFATT